MTALLVLLALRGAAAGPSAVQGPVVPLPPVIVEGQAPPVEPAPASVPSSEPAGPPDDPEPAREPDGLDARAPELALPPATAPSPPPGFPLDLLPHAPVDGVLAYLVEVAAVTGTAQLLAPLGCVPLLGPVAYAVLVPPVAVHVLERAAREWTTSGPGHRDAALVVAHLVEGLAGLFMLGGQLVLGGYVTSIALLAGGSAVNNLALVSTGGLLLAGSTLGGLALLGLLPLGVVAGLAGPHLEVLAYRHLGPTGDGDGPAIEFEGDSDTTDDAGAPSTPTRGRP